MRQNVALRGKELRVNIHFIAKYHEGHKGCKYCIFQKAKTESCKIKYCNKIKCFSDPISQQVRFILLMCGISH